MLFALLLAPAALAISVPCGGNPEIGLAADASYGEWQAAVDPDKFCTVDYDEANPPQPIFGDETYGYFDADEVTDTKMSLLIRATETYTDHAKKKHTGTKGVAPSYDGSNGRWLLACKQTSGEKTLRITVTRPQDILGAKQIDYFQGEFLAMYRKGTWIEERFEKEPYTHNNFGSVVPLDEFRGDIETGCASKDAACYGKHALNEDADLLSKDTANPKSADHLTSPYFNVFIEAPDEGDFEFRYGNPNLILGRDAGLTAEKYAACLAYDGSTAKASDAAAVPEGCGTWTAVSFSKSTLRVGTPWKSCGTGTTLEERTESAYDKYGAIVPAYLGHPNLKFAEFEKLTTAVLTAKVDTYVVLDIFSPGAGNLECDDTECKSGTVFENNIDKWTYSGKGCGDEDGKPACSTLKSACNAKVNGVWADAKVDGKTLPKCYNMCYKSGNPCPDEHSVCDAAHCNIDKFGAIIDGLTGDGSKVKVLAFIETEGIDDQTGEKAQRTGIQGDVDFYKAFDELKGISGFFFNRVDSTASSKTANSPTKLLKTLAGGIKGNPTIVFATGQALLDGELIKGADSPDIVVTLSADEDKMKDWSPYALFPDAAPAQWGALLTGVENTEDNLAAKAKLLFDRGYGYVGLHPAAADTADVHTTVDVDFLKDALDKIADAEAPNGRRLQGRELAEAPASTYTWSCDAAQFYCAPVCMRTTGFVTAVVPDSKCEGEKQSCSCSCLFDAHWDCVDGAVVCKATHTTRLVPEIVGDLVCSTRGTEKPETCIRQLTARGTYPEEQCLTQFEEAKTARLAANVARKEAAAAREAARVAAEAKAATTAAPTEKAPELADVVDVQSSALPAALLAFAGLFA